MFPEDAGRPCAREPGRRLDATSLPDVSPAGMTRAYAIPPNRLRVPLPLPRCREGQEGCVRGPSQRPYVARLVVHRECLADPRRVSLSGLSYSQIAQQIGISEQRVVDSAFFSVRRAFLPG